METQASGQSKGHKSYEFYKKLFKLTIGGGVIFWITTILTSLFPIAAEYRAVYSNWRIHKVWFDFITKKIKWT